MTENNVKDKIKEFGFNNDDLDPNEFEKSLIDFGWDISRFKRNGIDSLPTLQIDLRKHDIYGINIFFNSIPEDETYKFSNGNLINERDALMFVEGYMDSARKGEKYQGR